MSTGEASNLKPMVTANTGRVVMVPVNTIWVSEIIVTTVGTVTGGR